MDSRISPFNTFSNASLGRLDAVLAAAHMLPKQTDVSGLLRMVKYCSFSLLAFQRMCLLIETPLRERARFYSLDVTSNSAVCSRLEMLNEEGKYTLFRQTKARMLTMEEFSRDFPAVSKLEFFDEARRCLLLPLSVEVNGYRAVLLFIWTEDSPLSKDMLSLCRVLGIIVSSSLSQLLRTEEQNMEIEALRNERDQLNILVDVGSVAASTLDLENLIKMVGMDLRRFFAVNEVALELREENDHVSLYSSEPRHNVSSGSTIPLKSALLPLFTFHKPFCLVREHVLQKVRDTDALAASFLRSGDHVACAFPLYFQQRELGALILAHSQAEVFTRDTVSLLAQIARVLAFSVNNAREYASIDTCRQRLVRENAYLSKKIAHQSSQDCAIIGQSNAIRKVLEQIEMVAASDSTVLLLGETGTGKELVAEAIHQRSQRKKRPMVKINCAAVPQGLLESELFGHEKGAFTGAIRLSKGRFELAHGSTLLLDEVGDMPLDLQPKLLRILQSRELERIGGRTVIPVDVRLIAATNQNLLEMVHDRLFRKDLYYRLNVFPIHLPPLRERREDIPLLAQHFMELLNARLHKNVSRISPEGLRWLCRQDWPGNVRELANVIERAVICSAGKVLNLEMDASTSSPLVESKPGAVLASSSQGGKVGREEIIAALLACNGLIAGSRGAAAYLGIKRTTLNSRIKRLGLNVKELLKKAH